MTVKNSKTFSLGKFSTDPLATQSIFNSEIKHYNDFKLLKL